MAAFVTAGAGFLLAVLWFDLMFDMQVLKHRRAAVPNEVLASIAGYYRRVTTDARPMNRLVGLVMVATFVAVLIELVRDEPTNWVAWSSLVLITSAILLAALHTFPSARRLATRQDPLERQGQIARAICRDHLLCLVGVLALMVIQLAFAR